jgi:hypothetical protein
VRRLLALLALPVLLLPAPSAVGQEEQGQIRLSLLSEAIYASRDFPLTVEVRATNETDLPLENLSLSTLVYPPARSRSEYGVALEADPVTTALCLRTDEVGGSLPPGESITVSIEWKLGCLAPYEENALHPMKIQLQTDFVPVADIRTALVYIHRRPKVPLNVAMAFVLEAPLRLRPDGRFSEGAVEVETAPGSRLETMVRGLEGLAAVQAAATMVVSPSLLLQLETMADGYEVVEAGGVRTVPPDDPRAERASDLLGRIREVARVPSTEVVALPYASPSVPAMASAGLVEDLAEQLTRGRLEVERLLRVPPLETVFHPPGSAISADAMTLLDDLGMEAVLVGPDVLPPPAGLKLTALPVAQIGPEEEDMVAIAPDPGVALRASSAAAEPMLRAHWTLGELSAIYFERPSVDRGVALLLDAQSIPSNGFFRTLLRGIAAPSSVQWLRAVKVTRLLELEPGPERDLRTTQESFSGDYLSDLTATTAAIRRYTAVAGPDTGQQGRLRTLILRSQHRGFLAREEEALAFLQAARGSVAAEFAKVELPPADSITTLTSQEGPIPVTIRSDAPYEMRVLLRLQSSKLRFLGGSLREVVLSQPVQRFIFPVRAQTTGRFPVTIEVLTPQGERIASSQIIVRSTAYNRVALVVTIGAAVLLAGLWARRFLPRRS